MRVTVIDYKAGNLTSVLKALRHLGAEAEVTDGDLALGDGVLLVRTPGHTSGNQTLFLNTAEGVWGVSENGTCADNWTPATVKSAGIG